MNSYLTSLLSSFLAAILAANQPAGAAEHESRLVAGWTVQIDTRLAQEDPTGLAKALLLLETQLKEIVRQVPRPAVDELQKVPLWFSPEYANVPPRAEYHPNADWLREHGAIQPWPKESSSPMCESLKPKHGACLTSRCMSWHTRFMTAC